VGGVVAVLLLCACAIIVAAGVIIYQASKDIPYQDFPTPDVPIHPSTDQPVPTIDPNSTGPVSSVTLDTLNTTLVPENDPYELACRLESICNVSKTVPAKVYKIGDKEKFWILNSDTVTHTEITATLLYITPHSYFWAQEGTQVDQADVKRLMDTFENQIYPTDREFFGSEWNPGVDNDPHIYAIYASGLGRSVAGYFNSSDSYNPLVKEHSNAHETFMLSSTQGLSDDYTYGVLAHEFVHTIQFASDRNDVSWLGEGFAEVGVFLNGYGVGGKDWSFTRDPDLQLNTWESISTGTRSGDHYGQAFLYLTYFLDRFGEEATQALTTNPENDIASVDSTLANLGITDPITSHIITADDVFIDWAAALYLMDENVGDGRYTYYNYPNAPRTRATETISECPQVPLDRSVNQYGIDYIQITCPGAYTLSFQGSTSIGLLPTDVHSGSFVYWSNKGDESDMTLTREFDLTQASGNVELSYWTWYDIEEDWDYVYVEASTDGQAWDILRTPSGTDYDPSGNSYGWGYTGATNGWVQETIDISQYAGQNVQIRFEYITDAAINGEGLLLDDIAIDAIGYQSDFETDDDSWDARGFVRVENLLPQTYRLNLILKSGGETTVKEIPFTEGQNTEVPLSLDNGDEAILIITGTTRYTTIPAPYRIEITK